MAAKLARQAKQQIAIIMPIMVTIARATTMRCEILKIVVIIDTSVEGATARHCVSKRVYRREKEF